MKKLPDIGGRYSVDRGIPPPGRVGEQGVGEPSAALPLVGYGVCGPGVVDYRAVMGDADAEHSDAANNCAYRLRKTMRIESTKPLYRKLSILMPVYNERWTLRTIVQRVLASPVDLEIELVCVDDGSVDGSRELLLELARADARIKLVLHPVNRGKGSAIRTAIEQMTGDVAVIQDADLEYDPAEYPRLLAPILAGQADAVFGSRFVGDSRRVLRFWHSLVNRGLTLVSNVLNNQNLTDMETCYKMARADLLKSLRLQSRTFTLEPEITCRLAQAGARIFEVPVSYRGRTVHEGKKIRAIDGVKALWEMVRCKFLDPRFTRDEKYYAVSTAAQANRYHAWLLTQISPYIGEHVLETGSGVGALSRHLLRKQRLILADRDAALAESLRERYAARDNMAVQCVDPQDPLACHVWQAEKFDTVLCTRTLEHAECDGDVLRNFYRSLSPGGRCIVVVPAGPSLHGTLDAALGHERRYTRNELAQKLAAAGFDVIHAQSCGRFGALGWAWSGLILRQAHAGALHLRGSDRLFPLTRWFDYLIPGPAATLIMVGRKPLTAEGFARDGLRRAA